MRNVTKSAFCAAYKYSGAMRVQESFARRAGRSSMAILLLHRVTDQIPEDGLTVSTQWFRGMCEMLHSRFHVVPLAEIYRICRARETPRPRTVAITFDDCYRDNLFAARVMAEHQLPGTFFIPTRYVGTDHIFEWDKHLPRMANLSWGDIHEMAESGHDVGSHTVSHPNLAALSDDEFRREIADSKQTLEERLGRRVRYLAYPFGGRDKLRADQIPMIKAAGYEGCVSAYGGFVDAHSAGEILPREAVTNFPSLVNFELHLTGCLNWFYAIKRRAGMIGADT